MLYCIVALLVIILDQWTKYWVAGNIVLDTGSKELIPGLVSLVNVHNKGVAFGFLSEANINLYLIALAGVLAVAVLILLATRVIRGELGRWSAVFVAAGGIGNAIDRLLYGFVQDMFKLDFFPQFAIFNVADVFITVFAILFILYLLFGGNKRRDEEVEFEDEDEEDRLDYEDEYDDEEEDEKPRRRAKKEKAPRRPARRRVEYDDEDDDFDDEEEDDEPAPRKAVKKQPVKKAAPVREEKPAPEKPVEYEEEYEAFKAARAARQQGAAKKAPAPARKTVQKPAPADDAFDAWDQAGGRAPAEREAAPAPVQKPVAPAPAPVQKPAPAPKASDMEFDLEDILNEFK